LAGQVKKAVKKCTLDQSGTKPFHLKATYAPSRERDKDSNRTGEVEIWWQSPTKWRREVRSPEFHQIVIVDGDRQWQKNDGDYFPDWLRELAVAIIRPVPLSVDVLAKRVKTAEVRHLMGQTNVNWSSTTDFADEQSNGKGYLALTDNTGLLLYTGGPGFGGLYHDFRDFHGRMIAYTVASGYVEVTAKVSVLEDIGTTPNGFFDASVPGGDAQPIDTVVLDEAELRKNQIPGKPFEWPALTDGPLEGVVWTEVVLDRTGKIREMISPIADNPGVKDAAERGFRAMQFQPVLRNGVPVQATGRLSVPFKTVRPAGAETFNSAKVYFENGRKASFLAAGATAPYLLRAEFQTGTEDGVQTGRYEDTWISATEWKREAWFGSSHLVKSQSGDKRYVLEEGTESGLLRLVMQLLEPIPAEDTMTESDWRIKRDDLDGLKTIRVFRGPEGSNGELEPGKSQGYWFDESGYLVKSYTAGYEIRPSAQEDYGGVQVPRRIDVLQDGKVGLRVIVNDIRPADPAATKSFKLKGHEWQRAFTAEVR
jgi:outer membrane lipoprotein-sorting protein